MQIIAVQKSTWLAHLTTKKRTTNTAQKHHVIRYGWDGLQYSFIMDTAQTLCDSDHTWSTTNRGKQSSGFSTFLVPISAAQKLFPVLFWWRWMHLCCASFEVSSDGVLSWSQALINWQARHHVDSQSPGSVLQYQGVDKKHYAKREDV